MQLFLNNWATTTAAEAAAAALEIVIAPTDAAKLIGLGAGDHYLLTLIEHDGTGAEIDWEIVKIIDADGITGALTIDPAGRGLDGTAARIWPIGTSIGMRVTAGALETLRDSGGPELSDSPPQALAAASAGASPEASRADHVHDLPTPGDIGAATAAQGAAADSAVQPEELSDVATSGAYADLTGKPFIPATPGDIGAATTAQGDLADTAVQPAALASALDEKVDKVVGKQLSTEDYTTAEKTKLAGLDEAHYKGTYVNLAALEAAHPTAAPGDYADVDAGAADPVLRYIWDDSDSEWVAQAGSADPVTAAQVKTLYESNADTNAFTDSEKSKLAGVAAGATANADTDSLAEGGTNLYHTAARVRDAVLTGLSLAVGTAVAATDSVLVAFGKLQKQINDLVTSVAGKQATLVSGTNIKTVNGSTLLGSGDLVVSGGASLPVVQTFTGNKTLALADINTYNVSQDTTAQTVTVPAQATVTWTADAEIHIEMGNTGVVTVTGATGVTINGVSAGSFALAARFSVVTLKRIGSDSWTLIGGLVSEVVTGPASAGDGNLALFDGTTGKVIKDGGAVTAAGLALLDDASAAAQATTLGLGTGNSPVFAALTLTNGQIVFPATQVPSANANTLDDYEEGTWTPVVTFATPGDLSLAYSEQAATYTKLGNRVITEYNVVTSSFTHSTAAGELQITGMPFPVSVSSVGALQYQNINKAGYTSFMSRFTPGSTTVRVAAAGSGVISAIVTASDVPTAGSLVLRGHGGYQ